MLECGHRCSPQLGGHGNAGRRLVYPPDMGVLLTSGVRSPHPASAGWGLCRFAACRSDYLWRGRPGWLRRLAGFRLS